MDSDHVERVRSLLEAYYPGWSGISDPRFVNEEIVYKRETIERASSRLSESALKDLIERRRFTEVIDRLEEIGREPHFLYLAAPRTGDLAILYDPSLDKEEFSSRVLDLLYGDGSNPERLERFSEWVDRQGLPNKWTFPTFFLFLTNPESNLFVKPQATRRFLDLVDADFQIESRPSGDHYRKLIEIAGELESALFDSQPEDRVPIHSVIWVAGNLSHGMRIDNLDQDQQNVLTRLLEEFGRNFVDTDEGRAHLTTYPEVRQVGQQNFEEVRAAKRNGQDITDLVLTKLLPHRDTPKNRARGAWIHIAPAISGDIRTWYENAGWVEPADWPKISLTLFEFVESVVEDPDSLSGACNRFAKSDYSKGFQTGMLTPILSALLPEQMILINNKSRAVVNHFLGLKHSQQINDYPDLNTAAHFLINRLHEPLTSLLPEGVSPREGFDAFSHWMVAIKGYRFGRTQAWKISIDDLEAWNLWMEGGYAGLREPALADVTTIKKKNWEDLRASVLDENEDTSGERLDEVWALAHDVQEGDLILVARGTDQVVGLGMVVGPYEYHEESEPQHRVPVNWQDTEVREVSQPSWRKRRFQEIEQDLVKTIQELRPKDVTATEGAFSRRTFELLEELHETPTREFYSKHQEEFREHVEEPLQELLSGIAALLPQAMKEELETEKRLFSRIPKNDFGRGGAWDFYWGAFYPRGGKRIAGAQLFVALLRDGLEYGFNLGEYGEDQRTRFVKNVRKRRDALVTALNPRIDDGQFLFGVKRGEDGRLDEESARSTLNEWLFHIDDDPPSVRAVVPPDELLSMPEARLGEKVLEAFRQLFPLVLLATTDDPLTAISEYWGPEEDEEEIQPEYPLEQCAEETGFEVGTLRNWVHAANRKGQAIFYGPPGTGKTFMAEHIAKHMVGGGDGFVELVQFHPAYAYEDFIQGIRPITRPDNQLEYQMVPGRFLDFCRRAQNRSGTCVLIIDEINRANLSRVFGELMYLLEYRDRDMPLSGGGMSFRIPKNVRLLGTMNTADRSIALVDHALRRRFAFVPLRPRFEILRSFHEESGKSVESLIEKLTQVNTAIGDPNYHLGITFFMDKELEGNLETIWRMEIEPYLEEYFFDDAATVERFRWDRIGEELGV